MRARWSQELAQDINAYYSVDAEDAMTQLLSDHIAVEIQSEVLSDLLQYAGAANYFWSRQVGKFLNKTTGATAASAGASFATSKQEWYQTLVELILDACNQIQKRAVVGRGNFIVTSPAVCTILESVEGFRARVSPDGTGAVGDLAFAEVGTLQGFVKVYRNVYFPENQILVGLKPRGDEVQEVLGSGYIYAPYVPLLVSPIIYTPEDFNPQRMVMTRYGTRMLRSEFFAKICVLGMDVI